MAATLLRRRCQGPRLYDWAAARLPAVWEFDGDEPTRQRWLLARRSITKPDELACFLASAPRTPPSPISCGSPDALEDRGMFQSAKNECGLE
ncbi:hypothetical protein ACIOEW_09070 [Streptomyces sp. NPDC087901]